MSKQANKTLIGGFVVGAVAILVVAVAVFASLDFLKKRQKYIIYFESSVYGLNVGAPVVFRGVEVGQVTDVYMQFEAKHMTIRTPVLIEIGGSRIEILDEKNQEKIVNLYREKPKILIADLIKKGLRAQLGMQSIVTGKLMVTLDFFPKKSPRFVDVLHQYPEIPTVPTTVQMLQESLRELPIQRITKALLSTLENMQRFTNSQEMKESIQKLNSLLGNVDNLISHLDQKVDPLASDMAATAAEARSTLAQTRKAIASAQGALENASGLLAGVKDEAEGLPKMQYEFTAAMREFANAASSFRVFIDYLERHPEMLLRGKEASTEGPVK